MMMLDGFMVTGHYNDGSWMVDDWLIDGLLWLIDGCVFVSFFV